MKDPIRKFEEEIHRHEVKGLKNKIIKLKQQHLSKYKENARLKKQVLQQQVTLVLLLLTLLWLFLLVIMWLN